MHGNEWLLLSVLGAALLMAPVLCVLMTAFAPANTGTWPHLASTVLPIYALNTLLLSFGVAFGALIIGIGTAWLVIMCNFPGRRIFEWALLMPLASPAYLVSWAYIDFLEYSGPLQSGLRDLFGWQTSHDYWFPDIRTLPGAILMMTLVLYPYVYMLARSAFAEQSARLIEASRTLGSSPLQTFFSIALPVARPAALGGVFIVMMETVSDYGTTDFFAIQTLTTGIFDTWLAANDLTGGAQIAVFLLGFMALLVFGERILRHQRRYTASNSHKPLTRYRLSGLKKWLSVSACLSPVIFGFCIPVIILGDLCLSYLDQIDPNGLFSAGLNSLFVSSLAGLLAAGLGLLLTYATRISSLKVIRFGVRCAGFGYALPGPVVALGVLIFFGAIDKWFTSIFESSNGLFLSGGVMTLIFAYLVRFTTLSINTLDASFLRTSNSMDMAARTLGSRPLRILHKLHIPLMRGSVLTAIILVFVDSMKELPATLILRPFNFETLATHSYQYASDELFGHAAPGALLIILFGLLPVLYLIRLISTSQIHSPNSKLGAY